jgi:small-conductance mechanosensitive channel
MKEPEPISVITEFADNSINLMLIFWLEDITRGKWPPRHRIMMAIWKEFQSQGIKIPFPQRDLHFVSNAPESIKV